MSANDIFCRGFYGDGNSQIPPPVTGENVKALILGIVVIAIAVITILPAGLGWGEDVLAFLRGALPIIAAFAGLILIFVGISDIKDKDSY